MSGSGTAMYLEQTLDTLESLPNELQRNFLLMRDLDAKAQQLMKGIDAQEEDFVMKYQTMSSDRRTDEMNKIRKQFDKAREYADDKVHLAIQTYELVDKHIRRLDADLARFEAEIKEKNMLSPTGSTGTEEAKGPILAKKGRKKGLAGSSVAEGKKKGKIAAAILGADEEATKTKKKKRVTVGIVPEPPPAGIPPLVSIAGPADLVDMPVDPNEPTYCLCHQVSYGEMIGCDNPDCTIEWFHFGCVGLTSKPKGKWYCPKCSPERKRK